MVYNLVFLPKIVEDKKNRVFLPSINLQSNRKYKNILKFYENNKDKYDEIYFFLGYDADENGELMAQAIRSELIKNRVGKKNIYRTPLTEHGYLSISTFLNINKYCRFLFLQNAFLERLKKKKKLSIGIRKILSLRYISRIKKKKKGVLNLETEDERGHILKNENSTFTYLYNSIRNA